MKNITIFTDGSSRGNPGAGGWAAVIVLSENNDNVKFPMTNVKEIGGREEKTTNNRMELTAVIKGLQQYQISNLPAGRAGDKCQIKICTDSSYVLNGITKWVYSWERRNWTTVNKEPVLNKDLWEELLNLVRNKKIDWKLVEGHVGVTGNERADVIATAFADGENIKLYEGSISGYSVKNILDISFHKDKKADKDGSKKKSTGKAYSYVSEVLGKVETHKTWKECEARVKGKKARFRKALSAEDEKALIVEFSKK